MNDPTLTRTLAALTVLLLAAHLIGPLFQRFRQPRAIGEIVGGILIGPSLLGWLAPPVYEWLFPAAGPSHNVVSAVVQLGLLLLMFCFGTEMRAVADRGQDRLVGVIAVVGITLPIAAGLAVVAVVDLRRFWGPAGNFRSFMLVFAIAIAVTSIPVISRIMYDLGILGTPFARVVVGVAVIEDVVLYVLLAVAVGLAAGTGQSAFGLPALLGLTAGGGADVTYHVVATLTVLAAFLLVARARSAGRLSRQRSWPAPNPVAARLLFLLLVTLLCLVLGVQTFLGALVAGIVVGGGSPAEEDRTGAEGGPADPAGAIPRFSFAFFIPLYFASVGVGLDLRLGFDPLFFAAFLVFACVVKAASVYLGARLGRAEHRHALNLALALNARGGPGIVLATVTYQAQLIDARFYACLVLLAVLTSLGAGAWLERQPREAFLAAARRPVPASGRTESSH